MGCLILREGGCGGDTKDWAVAHVMWLRFVFLREGLLDGGI